MLARLQSDLKTSMLAKDASRTQVLRMALAAYKNEAVTKGLGPGGELPESEAQAVFRRLVKSREDSVEQYRKAGREDRAQSEQAEIAILDAYLPKLMQGTELEAAVKAAIAATGAATKKDLGAVMKHLMAAHPGLIDGKAVTQLLQGLLA